MRLRLSTKRAVCSVARICALVRQNARDAGGGERVALGRAAADPVVLHEDDPIALAGVPQPGFVVKGLAGLLA